MEVDASTTGVGAVLSQQQGTPAKISPCALLLSSKLSPAERNYDIGNRELLAIKLALEEWRHWLKGAHIHSLSSLTIKTCNICEKPRDLTLARHNGRSFSHRFNFTISYRPGPKNVKADALSRLHAPEEVSEEPELIISKEIIVSPIQWTSNPATPSNASTATPPGCPQGLQYVTRAQRTPLIHSAHTSWALATQEPTTPSHC